MLATKNIFVFSIFLFFLLFSYPRSILAINSSKNDKDISETALDDELAWLKAESEYISIATKGLQKVSEAPSIVTVITAKEIEDMGARTLTDVLRIVPGFDIIKDGLSGITDFATRGVRSANANPTVKLHIDGHSINVPLDGSFTFFFDDLTLKNVRRIEIIRGPGSAIYGENAFLGVINIVTKDVKDIDGVKLSTGFGSHDTQEYNIEFGKSMYGIDISGLANFNNTNGLSDTIKEDAISSVPFARRFSKAPGDTDDSRNKLDLNLKLAFKNLEFKAKYMNRDIEPFVGTAFVLTDDGDLQFNYVMSELSYRSKPWDWLTISPRVYYDQYDMDLLGEAIGDGVFFPIDLNRDGDIERFPNGILGRAKATNRRLGSELQFDVDIKDNNKFTLGFEYKWERQDNVQFYANFDPGNGASLGGMQNVSDIGNWIRRVYRQIWALYIQDEWDITNNLGVTFGIRHDHYSDFEGTTNPRLGLTWNFMENATLKLLYGQAFRAPNFAELYTVNNPTVQGTPDMQPETIRTYEIGLNYKFAEWFDANVNYFFNVIRDQIGFRSKRRLIEPLVYDNLGGSNVQGVEFEIRSDLSAFWDNAYVFANYSYMDAESKGDPLWGVPKHKGNVGINANISKYVNANLHAFISDDRVRAQEDKRDDSPGYVLVNLTMTLKEFFKGMEVKASINNLLDKDYNDPSQLNTVPTDLPRPGRTFYIELGYEF